ncbi:MAG: class I SAM-dependent methyltransferase [Burkholderiales bacterium]|jgi:SAM-dependent methyltransferase|nr:class I SAM-dependent methyltransferase [Burkholderiales bacterium]
MQPHRGFLSFLSAAALWFGLTSVFAGCEYATPPNPSPDGINKSYCSRQIARVMGWQGADWLERPERVEEERTDILVNLLPLKRGMVVGDIGAGTGYFSRQLLGKVQPFGQVWAVDVQPQMVSQLNKLANSFPPGAMRVQQADTQQLNLPGATLDVAIMVDVYHELEFPKEIMQSLISAMKPGGKIVFVEYRANDVKVPIKPLHTMSESQIKQEAGAAGLVFESIDRSLPWQYVLVFRRP